MSVDPLAGRKRHSINATITTEMEISTVRRRHHGVAFLATLRSMLAPGEVVACTGCSVIMRTVSRKNAEMPKRPNYND